MKIASSLLDDFFDAVERLVRRFNRHRSEVYADALREYVARHAPDETTRALDETAEDEFVAVAARRTLSTTEW